jgi:hypothetical protein
MPNDPIQAMEFAQSKGQARKDGRTGVTFADVAGAGEAVRQLQFVVEARSLFWLSPFAEVPCMQGSKLMASHRAADGCMLASWDRWARCKEDPHVPAWGMRCLGAFSGVPDALSGGG